MKNKFSNDSQTKWPLFSGFKKTFIRDLLLNQNLPFLAFSKKGNFQDLFLNAHSFMGKYGMIMILGGVLAP